MRRRILLLILSGFFAAGATMAQQNGKVSVPSKNISAIGSDKYYYANRNEPPRAIEFADRTVTASHFLANINTYLDVPKEFTFKETESNTDNLGMKHRAWQQFYKGIPVEGMVYRVHEKTGFITSANGKAARDINLDSKINLSEESAFHLAKRYLQSQDTTIRKGRMLIASKNFTFTAQSFAIAWQFDIDVSFAERWRISIDARDGRLINKVSLVNTCFNEPRPPLPYGTGVGKTSYYGNQPIRIEKFDNGSSRLVGETEHGGKIGTYDIRHFPLWLFSWGVQPDVYDFYSPNDTFADPYQETAATVQWGAEHAFEYYFKKHNRNSFDNNGGMIKCYTHLDNNLNNAFWNGSVLAFGDGSNNNPLVQLDVVAHELTHGVTQHEAQLQYWYESGALNESFSDIFGKAVEFDLFGDSATWLIAKQYRPGGLRDFSNPNLQNQADTYQGNYWYTGDDDYGGVHYNSGVQNFWFYLLSVGGSGVNDHQMPYSINAIGIDAAANISYRNLTEYLGPASDYLDSRIGSQLAAADLYGSNSAIYQEVDKAWDAVGVINEPTITTIEIFDITATTAKVRGTLIPRSDVVTYQFEYGTTLAYGSSSAVYTYTDKIEGIVTGMQSGTKYYLRTVATNKNGSNTYASEFTTISLAPLVQIRNAADVTETTATLRGKINPNSLPTGFYFEYGPTPSFGSVTPTYQLPGATEFMDVSAVVTGLQSRQTYYYRMIAVNNFASPSTGSLTFFTASKPVITTYTPLTAAPGTEITITGHNFSPVAEKNQISFGSTRAPVLTSSATEIKVKVPVGASLAPITLLDTESGLGAESPREFVPTFTGEFSDGNLQLRVGLNDIGIYAIKVEDMDGDNKPDIVTSNYQGFSVFQNVNQGGDITSESFIRNSQVIPDIFSAELFVADMDGNGLKDIIVQAQNGLRIYPNLSVPGYIFFGAPVELPMGYARSFVVGDFDDDGHIDIAYTTSVTGDTTIFAVARNQNPKNTLAADNFEIHEVISIPGYIPFLHVGDLNNDNKPDLMAGPYDGYMLWVLKNTSHAGEFAFDEQVVQDPTRATYARYLAQDINQDGWKDIISYSPYFSGHVALIENKSNPSNIIMDAPVVALTDYEEPAVQPADINGDGKVDLLVGISNRTFYVLENKDAAGAHLSTSTFEKSGEYGMPLVNSGSGQVETRMAINDLNGDGRPDVIAGYTYNFGPRDGYLMEVWQNSASDCIDPSLVQVNTSLNMATIVLPANTSFDQYEIEYTQLGYSYWWTMYEPTLYVSSGYTYQIRVRAKCFLGFTNYHYITFTIDCVDTESFSITNIGSDNAYLDATNFGYFEIQYSLAGKGEWTPQYHHQMTNLLPGATYDVRFRGMCSATTEFKYKQFTTLCAKLSGLSVTNITYSQATVRWITMYPANAILEYSSDNTNWTAIDGTNTMHSLVPGTKYFVRGAQACTNINSDFIFTSFTTPCPAVSALGVDSITPFSAVINWADESNTNNYAVTYSISGGAAITTGTGITSLQLDGLKPGSTYTVSVAPQCIGTPNVTSTTFSTGCYVPFNLTATDITRTSAALYWSDNFTGIPYEVDYSILESNVWQTIATPLTNTSLSDLRPGTTYEARVHITCLSETPLYASVRFETRLYDETTFFPNPTDGKIVIHPSKDLIGNRFNLYNSVGRNVASGGLLDYTIDLSPFPPGIYTLKIEGEKPMRIDKK